ncbi:MAG TPA: lytic transglycosylase domain-containing protein [Chthoniobacterales bacterium]|nr:lytic transglycosylase domain-containing protein [Chthoniobacterales bacterium]
MTRFFFKLIICLLLAAALGLGLLAWRSGDPLYTLYEWLSPARFAQYDQLIRAAALPNDLDPMLVKAVVWRESRFDPKKFGSAGERGLMQVSEIAAQEWAQEKRIPNFQVEQLFDPKTNLEAGTWYLRRAMLHWRAKRDPKPFALAEYNAGASRAQRWAGGDGAPPISAHEFERNIDFPGTKKYVESIIDRYHFYQRRGRM